MIRVCISTKEKKYIKTFPTYEDIGKYIQADPKITGAEILE